MTLSTSSQFRFLDRKKQDTVVLIPGWATDYRIFTHLDLEANYLFAPLCSPVDFPERLLSALDERNLSHVSLFGVSLGGFLAAQFATRHPQRVRKLVLVSIREQYPAAVVEQVVRYLAKNKKTYLSKFYDQCCADAHYRGCFARDLFSEYCATFELPHLLETLQYLKEARIEGPELAELAHIKIIHGARDRIAPCIEAYEISTRLYNADFVCIPDAGHFPFLSARFPQNI